MISKETIRELVSRLLEKSRKSQVRWIVTSDLAYGEVYHVELPNASIRLYFHSPRVDPDRYEFEIKNSTGYTVGRLTAEDDEESHSLDWELLRDCYDEATRAVHRWDETISTIETALSTDSLIGEQAQVQETEESEVPF